MNGTPEEKAAFENAYVKTPSEMLLTSTTAGV